MRRFPATALAAGAFFLLPALLAGQDPAGYGDPGQDERTVRASAPSPDFLFQRPTVSIALKGGMFFNRGRSDVYDDLIEHLTLQRSDFRGGAFGIDLGIWAGDRLEVAIGVERSEITRHSESRNWVEDDGSPIVQSTRVRQGPALSGGLRAYLFPRGESISRFAWVPRPLNGWVGGGVGWTGYEFSQWGDFVIEEGFPEGEAGIISANLNADGSTFFPYAAAGLEYALRNRVSLVTEARYLWADGELGRDFGGFQPVDLSGLRLTAGLAFRL